MEQILHPTFKKKIINAIFPNKCMFCEELLDDIFSIMCTSCQEKYNKSVYEHQFKAIHAEEYKILSLLPYKEQYRDAIFRWKFFGIRKFARSFAKLMVEDQDIEATAAEVIIPVPVAKRRYRDRGFNQAADLAYEIGKLINIPVYDCLKRTKETTPQSECDYSKRHDNIKDSIGIKKNKFNNKKIENVVKNAIILDDIYTTGSTVDECISVLRQMPRFRNTNFTAVVVARGKV